MKRRSFLKKALASTAGTLVVPTIIPSHVIGKNPPSDKINIGQIGFGRIAMSHDLPETLKYDLARVIAVSDLDRKRKEDGKRFIESWYEENKKQKKYVDVKTYDNYREMLANSDIDAVIISTPDHWHAQPAIEAALAGKDIYLQKPASLTIEEGRAMSDVMNRTGRIFQIGSQQRSMEPWSQFHRACELVRNGRIGALHTVKVGLGDDPSGPEEPEMPIPENLNYEMWLGSTPYVYYTEKRVHPREGYSRPGWLRCEQFGAGMITGWGAHHIDIAHWGMNTEYTGPIEIESSAGFPQSGLWNVHGKFNAKAKYANGVTMLISSHEYPNGVRFEGAEGWIFVSKGDAKVTASEPGASGAGNKSFNASDLKILSSKIGENEIHLYESPEHHGNWLDCIKSRKQTITPAEIAHRSGSVCLLVHAAMKLSRKLYWDPGKERFKNDDEANAMVSRSQRYPWGVNYVI